MQRTGRRLLWLWAVAAAANPAVLPGQNAGTDDPDLVRPALTAVNKAWSRVRLAYDSAGAEQLLGDGFYAAVRDQRLTRQEFISRISRRSATTTLVRFDNPIMTIVKGEKPGEWAALVQEKLEYDRLAPDGTKAKSYSLWYTRDTYRQVGPDQWVILSTEEAMHQSWPAGKKPPFPDW